MAFSKQSRFNAQFVDRFVQLPTCCPDCAFQTLIYWFLILFSIIVLNAEWFFSNILFQFIFWIFSEIMRSFSYLLFPAYFRFLKPRLSNFIRKKRSNRWHSNYGMRRNENDVAVIETQLGGKVYYDITPKMPRIERPHPEQLEGEPKCLCCCPSPMSGHRMLIIGHFAYVYGGLCQRKMNNSNTQLSSTVWRFSLINNSWKQISLEQEAHNITPVSYSWVATRKWGVLTFGGTGYPFGTYNGDRLCQFIFSGTEDDQKFRLMRFEYDGECPPACYGGVLVADEENDRVYYSFGTDGHEYYSDVYQGDITEIQQGNFHVHWTRISNHCISVDGRYRHESVLFQDKLLFFGGGNSDTLFSVASITYFDLKGHFFGLINTIADLKDGFPANRDCFALTKYEDFVYLMGGRGDHEASILHNDIWSLNLNTMQWKKNPMVLSFKTSFHASAVDENGRIYVFGGHRGVSGRNSTVRTNMMQSFLVSPPTLSNICQRFIAQTYKKSIHLSDEAFLSPLKFLKEVLPYYNKHNQMSSRKTSSTSSSSYKSAHS